VFVRCPRTGVEVALHSDAQPSEERVRHLLSDLVQFAPVDALRVPMRRVEVVVGGRQQSARRLMDGIDVMHERGSINDAELIAAREYGAAHTRANYVPYGSLAPSGVATGGRPINHGDWVATRISARRKLETLQAFLGDPGRSEAFLAVHSIAGLEYGLRRMVETHGQSAHYWRAAFKCGLQAIVQGYMEGRRKPPRIAGAHQEA
jgi:hypothetical protein